MAEIEITIDRRPLSVQVEDGDEARIKGLADELSEQIQSLRRQAPGAKDAHLLLLTALILKSDLATAVASTQALKNELANALQRGDQAEQAYQVSDQRLAELINRLVDVIDNLAPATDSPAP